MIERTIDYLPLDEQGKATALEYAANILYQVLCKSGLWEWGTKSYDPLTIEGHVAHSYVFDFEDGGRHHPFRDYEHLERMLVDEGVKAIREAMHPEEEEEDVVDGTVAP